MCWATFKKNYTQCHTADKNIQVFKVCKKVKNQECISYYYYSKYTTGQAYKETLKQPMCNYEYCIGQGLHSYCHQRIRLERMRVGIAARNDKDITLDTFYERVVKLNCIIPQGASYYLNELGEYVSSELIPVSIEEIP